MPIFDERNASRLNFISDNSAVLYFQIKRRFQSWEKGFQFQSLKSLQQLGNVALQIYAVKTFKRLENWPYNDQFRNKVNIKEMDHARPPRP